MVTVHEIAKMIDHSLLRPDLNERQVREGCRLARQYHTASVCIRPTDVKIAMEELKNSDVIVSTVIGFPHGSNKTEVKVLETREALKDGALELDMVMNIGKFLAGDFEFVERDIKAVCDVAHGGGAKVKVITENCYLPQSLKVKAYQIAERAGADWVKTSTGCGTGPATNEDLLLMRATCSEKVGVKSAGQERSLDEMLFLRSIGVSRVGITVTKDVLDEAQRRAATDALLEYAGESSSSRV